MRTLATLSIALLATAAPAHAADVGGGQAAWGNLCSVLDVEDVDEPCLTETCALPNESFPEVPDEVLPVEVNASQCLGVVIEVVMELLPLASEARPEGPAAG